MNNLEELMTEQLMLIDFFTILNPVMIKNINIKPLLNIKYTADDTIKMITHILNNDNTKVKERESSKECLEFLNSIEKIGLDISEIKNPFLSLEQLKFITEFKCQGIDIDFVINPNLTVEEMSMIVSYVFSNGYDVEYDVIRYMERASIDELIFLMKSGIGVLDFLKECKNSRELMISHLNNYINDYECLGIRVPTHGDFVKVYVQNRYKKNN